MEPRKLKTILIVLLIVAVVLAGVFWWLLNSASSPPVEPIVEEENQNQQTQNENIVPPVNNQPQNNNIKIDYDSGISESDRLKSQLRKTVVAFTERYGSYSNQADFANLEDLMPFMTQSLQNETSAFIRAQRLQNRSDDIYYGMTSQVLDSEIIEFAPQSGLIIFELSTQRNEMSGSTVNKRTFYQDVRIELDKEGGVWKVNKITWL